MSPTLLPIPQPRTVPLIGNLPDLDADKGVLGLMELAQQHGPIFKLALPGRELVVVSSRELVDELCDETRFDKLLSSSLREVRRFAGDGLFTAETQEPTWGAAHRILMPAFGPAALRDMADGMVDIADQLLVKWERQGPDAALDVADDTTRLALDTIALCSFTHRFNSLYSERMNPFVGAMVRALVESGNRTSRLPIQNRLKRRAAHQYDEDTRLMHEVADQLVADRRRHPLPNGRSDILDTMLSATDPATGEHLSDENIRYQLVTFLIAGHETTSGLLTFTLHQLMKHPEVLARAQAQVDEVCGGDAPAFTHLSRLTYVESMLKESLRLWPTAPAFALQPYAETEVIGGRYEIHRGQVVLVLIPQLHRDPEVWEDPEAFEPDRFSFTNAQRLPSNAWKPFGNGQRSCIGRGFALQEATLFLAMMLQRFDVTPHDPGYDLEIAQTLTIKPKGLLVHAKRRDVTITPGAAAASVQPVTAGSTADAHGTPLRVLFGSNAGTSRAFAERIASDGAQRGFDVRTDALDAGVDDLPGDGATVIVTSSYEGLPPDNARAFVSWASGLGSGALDGARYAVFGNGNRDWARTYQAVPTAVDEDLARAGATRVVQRGEADARGDFFGDFENWAQQLWPALGEALGLAQDTSPTPTPSLEVEFVGAVREPLLRAGGLALGTVVVSSELVMAPAGASAGSREGDGQEPWTGSTRHVEIALPEGMTYRTGDYLAVLPTNPPALVDRALTRFGLHDDTQVVLRAETGTATSLPTDTPVTAGELLSSWVELVQPATRRQVGLLAASTACPPDRDALAAIADDPATHQREVLDARVSVLDLMERHPSCQVAFASYLQMLQPLTPRQYSISSTPRWSEDHVTLTVAVQSGPARSGSGLHEGVASTFLAHVRPGTRVAVRVAPSQVAFHPPALDVPVIMVAAGSGIAPFRGFLADRALEAEASGAAPAPALLFFGCHAPGTDLYYDDELTDLAGRGLVDVRTAFSREPVDGVRHVQERLWADRADVVDLVRGGASFFVCGDGQRMAPAVYATCRSIYAEATGATPEQADAWLTTMQREHGRYVADVFA